MFLLLCVFFLGGGLRLLVLKLNCFYSMTHWSFLFLDDPWSTGYHYDDHFSSSVLCDPQFLCLNSERVVWNKCKFKSAVLSAQLQQTNYSDHGDFRKLISELMFLFGFAVCGGPSTLQATQGSRCQSCMLNRKSKKINILIQIALWL